MGSRFLENLRRRRRAGLGGLLVLAALGTIVSSATPGRLRQTLESEGVVTLVDIREYAGTGFGGENAHVLRLDFQVTPGGTANAGGTSGTTGGTTTGGSTSGGTIGGAQPDGVSAYRIKRRRWVMRRGQTPLSSEGIKGQLTAADMVDVPPSMQPTSSGGTGTSTGSSGSSTTGTGGSTGGSPGTSTFYFGVDKADGSSLTMNGSPSGEFNLNGGHVDYYQVPIGGAHFEYRLPPGTTTRKIYYTVLSSGTDSNGNPTGTTVIWPDTLAISRLDTPAVSIDSRTVYGQPNLDGEQPGDPNADLRNVSFAGWVFRGGLFVGNAPSGSGDQSGTARIQAYAPSGNLANVLGSSLTLLALGRPGAFSAPVYAAYVPSTTDPNLGTSTASVTWANRWNLLNATAVGSGDGLAPVPLNEYARCFFPGPPSNLIVALADEANAVASGTKAWQYFSTPGYEAMPGATFPVTDSRPRTWVVQSVGDNGGTYYGP